MAPGCIGFDSRCAPDLVSLGAETIGDRKGRSLCQLRTGGLRPVCSEGCHVYKRHHGVYCRKNGRPNPERMVLAATRFKKQNYVPERGELDAGSGQREEEGQHPCLGEHDL